MSTAMIAIHFTHVTSSSIDIAIYYHKCFSGDCDPFQLLRWAVVLRSLLNHISILMVRSSREAIVIAAIVIKIAIYFHMFHALQWGSYSCKLQDIFFWSIWLFGLLEKVPVNSVSTVLLSLIEHNLFPLAAVYIEFLVCLSIYNFTIVIILATYTFCYILISLFIHSIRRTDP